MNIVKIYNIFLLSECEIIENKIFGQVFDNYKIKSPNFSKTMIPNELNLKIMTNGCNENSSINVKLAASAHNSIK